jgi:caffeoyl-CoA O-methyltransferase
MMNIEQYILEHIDKEEDVLYELNRQTHLKILQPRMLSGHLQGKILEMLSKMISPKNILEIGTFTGYSAICLSKGLQNGGVLDSIEIDDELEFIIRTYFEKAGVSNKINLFIGDALQIIPQLNKTYQLIFIDGDKRQYLNYYHCVFDKLDKGGFIFADNVLWDGKVIEKLEHNDHYTKGILEFNDFIKNDTRIEKVIIPIRDGITVMRKK